MRIVPSRIQGLTLIEVLIVLAIIGIILGLGVFNGRQALTGQQERAAVNSIRQSAWQGATAAAARGARVFLRVEDNELLLRLENQENGRVIRRESLPRDFVSNIPEGTLLEFTPPGKVVPETLPAPGQYTVGVGDRTLELEFSLIGEVVAR